MSHEPTPSPLSDTLSGGIWILLADGLFIPTALVIAAYLARRLGPSDYGLFVLAATIAGWLEWTLASFFARAAIREVAAADDWQAIASTVLRASLWTGLAIGVALWLLAGTVGDLMGEPSLGPLLRLSALNAPLFGLVLAHRFVLTGLGRFRARAVASAARWLGRLALVLLLVQSGFGVRGAIAATIAATAIEFLVARVFVRPSFGRPGRTPWRALSRLAIPLFLAGVSTRVFERLDLVFLQALSGRSADVGTYGVAQSLAALPGFIVTAFAGALLSSLAKLVAGGDLVAARALSRQTLRAVLWLVPLASAIAGASSDIVLLVFGRDYRHAGPVLAILCVASVSRVVISVASTLLTAVDRTRMTVAITAPLVPLAIAGHILVIPRYGAVGAAVVTASVSCLIAGAALVAVRRVLDVAPTASTACRVAILALGAYLIARHLPGQGVAVVPKMIAAVGFVAAGLFVSGEVTLADVRSLGVARTPGHPSSRLG